MQFDQRTDWGRDTYQVRYVHAAYSVLDLLLAAQPKEFLSHVDSEAVEMAEAVVGAKDSQHKQTGHEYGK